MPRPALSNTQRVQGEKLGKELRRLRGTRTAAEVANEAGVPLDTLRKLEQGGTATPGFFLVAQVAQVLNTPLNQLVDKVMTTKGQRR
ncbi:MULTISPECIES: helix-turn-helix domain-containing protein [Mycobacteriaceae]|uniref:helix-turn-helix domain-containing protein n=1 Tax=Mycobacteriaceae TaxID=1762 RepID=UPI000993D6F3|nr:MULTISPECIES: helix-turn-helix transcriptional regulator [Mycobacteriaceae]MDM2175033.1 helix-turn-helix transcriptional regulator [Mycobacteroides abscessus]SKL51443.1 Helix-turn-helix protein [Mycobacteroides abscessus subsp. bolletii]MDM2179732.1 helix-turn-helix transcriptional regulator [Mycobacteroides abscessus]MDM2207837.1 helix-turn-helix transcriptional regulator [Mycobacteroides abscessus]MDM2211417.1 helix-turn-helix transcriptional regulator [Mycobacteroides abscessus]